MDAKENLPVDAVKIAIDTVLADIDEAHEVTIESLGEPGFDAALRNIALDEASGTSSHWERLISAVVKIDPVLKELSEFRRWFADSKVVDSSGRPRFLHAVDPSVKQSINGDWFVSSSRTSAQSPLMESGAVLNIRKPAFYDSLIDSELVDEYNAMIGTNLSADEIAIDRGISLTSLAAEDGPFRDWLKNAGYDGVVTFVESGTDHYDIAYLPFSHEQVLKLETLSSAVLAKIEQGDGPTPSTNSRGLPIGTDQAERDQFYRWFQSSKATDEDGRPLVLYRGVIGHKDLQHGALHSLPRDGYAVFTSTSEHVAASYGNPPDDAPDFVGAIVPIYVKAKSLVEFPVTQDRMGRTSFNKFRFDEVARTLAPGSVLVARGVVDYGPRANITTDPEHLYSFANDVYAFGVGTETIPAVGAVGPYVGYTPSADIDIGVKPDAPLVDSMDAFDDEFTTWFKDSSITGASGAPKIVFHATDRVFQDFENPELGYHFAETEELAHNAAMKGGKNNTSAMQVYLSLEKVVEINGQGNGFKFFNLLDDLLERGHLVADKYNSFMDEYERYEEEMFSFDDNENRMKLNLLTQHVAEVVGADGFKYWNEFDSGPDVAASWSYIALHPSQIKLASDVKKITVEDHLDTRKIDGSNEEIPEDQRFVLKTRAGTNLDVYHGAQDFRTVFEPSVGKRYTLGREYDVPVVASFFTPDPAFAGTFGNAVTVANIVMRKSIDLREGAWGAESDALEILIDHFGESVGTYPPEELWEILDNPKRVDQFKALGYDGVILLERESDGTPHDTYAVFNSEQVVNIRPHSGSPANGAVASNHNDSQPDVATGAHRIVDGAGVPRVYYHGTGADVEVADLDPLAKRPNGKRTSVEAGIHLTSDPVFASHYARRYDTGDDGIGANVMPLIVHAQKVWRHTDPTAIADFSIAYAKSYGEEASADVMKYAKEGWWMVVEGTTAVLRKQFGYDALTVYEAGTENLIVFSASQLESAISGAGQKLKQAETVKKDAGSDGVFRVYHGTEHEFDTFKTKGNLGGAMGHWFASTKTAASVFAEPRMAGNKARVIHADIVLRSPAFYEGHEGFQEAVRARRGQSYEDKVKSLRRSLVKSGFDGVVIRNSTTDDGGLRDDYIVFNSKNILIVDYELANANQPREAPGQARMERDESVRLYHGTKGDFARFDTSACHTIDKKRLGAYFTSSEPFAKLYGDRVLEVDLRVSKSFDITGLDAWSAIDTLPVQEQFKKELRSAFKGTDYSQYGLIEAAQRKDLRGALEERGYDCIKYTEGYADAYVAFDADRIAIANQPTISATPAVEPLPHALIATPLQKPFYNVVLSKMLKEGGLSPDARRDDGECLLASAIRHGRAEMMKSLLDAGAARQIYVEGDKEPINSLQFAEAQPSKDCATVLRAYAAREVVDKTIGKTSKLTM